VENPEEEPHEFYWTSAWAVHLSLSVPVVIREREIGDIYWMQLIGSLPTHMGGDFTLTNSLLGGINLWLFHLGSRVYGPNAS
jgi:hypothetical protein